MCGIIGYVGTRQCSDLLLTGLDRLEYRGYDSAGLAIVDPNEGLQRRRSQGRLANLRALVADRPPQGTVGVAHTRWATHGGPTTANSHPHRVDDVALVHNGIIENYRDLKAELQATGGVFESETDTEVVAHLVARGRRQGLTLIEAVRQACLRLVGAYSLVVVDAATPDRLVAVRMASPLVVGLGEDGPETFVASDVTALLEHTRHMAFLDDHDLVEVSRDGVVVMDMRTGAPKNLTTSYIRWTPAQAEKAGYAHFMLKEIHDQPDAVGDTLRGRIDPEAGRVTLEPGISLSPQLLESLRDIHIVACGTSWHAGLVGRYLFEEFAGLSPHVALASEFRYRRVPLGPKSLVLAISQSGETADTLQAIHDAKARGAHVISICNVQQSSIPRASDATFYTHAGPEIGVASTKAFTTQLVALHLLALDWGRKLGHLDADLEAQEVSALWQLPTLIESMLDTDFDYGDLARAWSQTRSALFLGRGALYPIALEGALKLKEISYIHAEGYAAGEMKHGPIALVEPEVPSVILCPRDRHFHKVRSNLEEIRARSGPVVALQTADDAPETDRVLRIPQARESLLPLLASIPMQLLAYHVAAYRGTDIDRPRNLAKSVTVE